MAVFAASPALLTPALVSEASNTGHMFWRSTWPHMTGRRVGSAASAACECPCARTPDPFLSLFPHAALLTIAPPWALAISTSMFGHLPTYLHPSNRLGVRRGTRVAVMLRNCAAVMELHYAAAALHAGESVALYRVAVFPVRRLLNHRLISQALVLTRYLHHPRTVDIRTCMRPPLNILTNNLPYCTCNTGSYRQRQRPPGAARAAPCAGRLGCRAAGGRRRVCARPS